MIHIESKCGPSSRSGPRRRTGSLISDAVCPGGTGSVGTRRENTIKPTDPPRKGNISCWTQLGLDKMLEQVKPAWDGCLDCTALRVVEETGWLGKGVAPPVVLPQLSLGGGG